jgi:lipopolysaccharide biosynthesis protein
MQSEPTVALRAVAFYLPQFHPIPENDEWWGPGFTEWTNVARARPLFEGHYQPHLPADLGFYDLRNPESRQQQADLARAHNIHGFCYWHYWFNGRRILERPFTEVLASGEPRFPFMLCWANENWTRVWDGGEHHRLLVQDYSLDDDRRHIRSLFPAFEDERYIRIDGKPVFGLYRTSALPDVKRTVEVWREEAQKAGVGDLYLFRVDAHEWDRPDVATVGLDAAVEFHPDVTLQLPRQRPALPIRAFNRAFRPNNSIRHHNYFRYEDMVHAAVQRLQSPAPWTKFPGLTPMWDNSPRRANSSTVFVGSTPDLYQQWLEAIVATFRPPSSDENLIFINAWNEWAEGNHLEPDLRWGRAYLEATNAALAPAVARRHEPL